MTALRTTAASVALIATVALGVGCAPSPLPDDGAQQACEIERATIETALEAWKASDGGGQYPSTFEDLIGVYIKPGSIKVDWLYGSDGASYSLYGPC